MEDCKPCPFCGGDSKIDYFGGYMWKVTCAGCGMHTPAGMFTGKERMTACISYWNTRPEKTTDDLAMMTRMLVVKVQKTSPNAKLIKQVIDYLQKNGFDGGILR